MKLNKLLVLGLLIVSSQAHAQQTDEEKKRGQDWANFQKMIEERIHKDWAWMKRYEGDNERLAPPAAGEKRVVFMGNSITEGWGNTDPVFFKGKPYVNRGIGGQTTPQMLVRFRRDVVSLKPKVVVILAGINDIAENTGPSKIEDVAGNIFSMAELAKHAGIKVILSSVLPAAGFTWHPGLDPRPSIATLNAMLKDYAKANKLGYIDYHTAMAEADGSLKKDLGTDGVHPNLAGYKVMEPLVEAEIKRALK
ncbi:SGNH/GDSL hydrolase family protein [Mucilaginibacter myungsuensis]|uniref:SGNH/GDSL hydrolase family protein n=1 Tax=Mucilaginibacter myungsuensis TaxID=649104 RepID=A0A929L1S0_9SPHI|nr:SGNH/GDSL hydrolase family protein [Mucilaginibacter myungsuensis]MBE9664675.1 SGNH/GDSL hydrolase family protein [Mucilaginibacter myungsuensis]MDN3601120.1 SGNH/GDSL hydrolase family protein [Mucilaginibacter myungsuensis]